MTEEKISPRWEFVSTGGGDEDGFNDPLIETFKSDPDRYLARESIQNVIDARLDPEKPVEVHFQHFELETKQFPGIDDIVKIYKLSGEYFHQNSKLQAFCSLAIELFSKKTTSVLKISDYNTKGLCGEDDEKEREWYTLVKGQGASSKEADQGGSFGIGKGAPYAASALRMVFYSTINDKNEHVFQGKARLASYKDNDGDVKRGIGSYCMPKQKSIRKRELIPDIFARKVRGTDIFVIGYIPSTKDWMDVVIKSVLDNFWAAILNKDLVVKVADRQIDDSNLARYLMSYCNNNNGNGDTAYNYYRAYTEPGKVFEEEIPYLGKVKLSVLLQEGFPKKIALMRKQRMLVKEKPFRSKLPFIGVFICENETGNGILKKMEPPSHTDWEPKRLEGTGQKVIDVLNEWVKQKLRSLSAEVATESLSIPGIERYFQMPEDADVSGSFENINGLEYTGKGGGNETNKETNRPTAKTDVKVLIKQGIPVVLVPEKGTEGEDPGREESEGGGGGNGESGSSDKGVSGDAQDDIYKEIPVELRSFMKKKDADGIEYLLNIRCSKDSRCKLIIRAVGDDNKLFPLDLIYAQSSQSSHIYKVEENVIENVDLTKNEVTQIVTKFKTKNKFSIMVQAYEKN